MIKMKTGYNLAFNIIAQMVQSVIIYMLSNKLIMENLICLRQVISIFILHIYMNIYLLLFISNADILQLFPLIMQNKKNTVVFCLNYFCNGLSVYTLYPIFKLFHFFVY